MDIYKNSYSITEKIKLLKKEGKSIGFVPTMGALHQGHISLIECSKRNNDITVVSIFVNPTQFNNPDDLQKYPRTFETDKEKLNLANCDILFYPSEKEIYPQNDSNISFDLGILDSIMEGKHRPGHFNGVATVVSKLFKIVLPDNAYFGQKDFQQLAVIKHINSEYLKNLNININACKIIREKDGLAMSSRNVLLSKEYRKNASMISEVIFESQKLSKKLSVGELKNWVISKFEQNSYLELEYFDIVNNITLEQVNHWNESNTKVACIAVYAGNIRLIDNIIY